MTCSTSPAVGAVGLTLGVVPAHPGAAVARGRSGVVGAVHLFGAVAAAVGTARDLRVVPVRLGLMAAAVVGAFEGVGGSRGLGAFGHRWPPAVIGPVARPVTDDGADPPVGPVPLADVLVSPVIAVVDRLGVCVGGPGVDGVGCPGVEGPGVLADGGVVPVPAARDDVDGDMACSAVPVMR